MPQLSEAQVAEVSKALAELLNPAEPEGTTPDDVATRLQQAGVRGCRAMCTQCPLAEWVKRKTGITVSATSEGFSHCGRFLFRTLSPFMRFMARFDLGHYPNLESWRTRTP